jgi:hypothetical protein
VAIRDNRLDRAVRRMAVKKANYYRLLNGRQLPIGIGNSFGSLAVFIVRTAACLDGSHGTRVNNLFDHGAFFQW